MPIKLDFSGDKVDFTPIVLPAIKKLIENYRADMRTGDTQSAWVSAEEINALLKDNNADGIRVYYGRHEKNDRKYPNQQNIILVATKKSDAGSMPSFKNSVDQLNEFTKDGIVNSVVFNLRDGDYGGMGADAIPLCPQNCPDVPPL
jgi:hypothetical protein